MRRELDAANFHLYLGTDAEWQQNGTKDLLEALPTPRNAAACIMDRFPIVRRNDEKAHGEYGTKRVILENYDEMHRAALTGVTYRTRLDPPPGDDRVRHPESTRPDWARK